MTTVYPSSLKAFLTSQEILEPAFGLRVGETFAEGLIVEGLKVRSMPRRPASRHAFFCDLIVLDKLTGKRSLIQLIGKRDTKRAVGKAAREFEVMRMLWDAGFDSDECFRIPRPVQHFPDRQLILQGKARGLRLRSHLGKGTSASLGHARMAGLWLAKLHNLKLSSPQVCTYTKEISSLRMFVAAVSADQPGLALELEQSVAVIAPIFASFHAIPATMVHGDFHPDHIFVDKDFVTVIDFERFSVSDPARDLGSFIAHVRTMAYCSGRSLSAANHEIDAFLGGYFSAVPLIQAIAIAPRVAPYVALSNLEALYYVASVLKVTDMSRIVPYVKCVRESELLTNQSAAFPLVALRASILGNRFSEWQ